MSRPIPGVGGEKYVAPENRSGAKSTVYFTKNITPEGLVKIFDKVCEPLSGRIGVKLHTGEKDGPNIIPRQMVSHLFKERIPDATILETNTFYPGDRYTTEQHRETIEHNGWTFAPVDIMDENGTMLLPVNGGKWFTEMSVGASQTDYDSFLALTHFKGHMMGGFGGSNKNIGIGCADGRIGKSWIHAGDTGEDWGVVEEELMERFTECTKSICDHFKNKISFINVMRNMSVSCDCEGTAAKPVVTPDVGILASLDICALDSACVDMIFALRDGGGDALKERMCSRHGLRQLTYMNEIGMGNLCYDLVDIDSGETITAKDAVADIAPGWVPDKFNKIKVG